MTSKKLRKYLAYYQKTLREEPDNIEARLRLAAVFRDMGREVHAIEEYATASRLLAREGLALEAIAACKAILELAPDHTDTLMFLARMYARVPDATGGAARIARPLQAQPSSPNAGRLKPSSRPEPTAIAAQPFVLATPKQRGAGVAAAQANRRLNQPARVADQPHQDTVVGNMGEEYEKYVASQRAERLSSQPTRSNVPVVNPENVRHTQEMDASDREVILRGATRVSQVDGVSDEMMTLSAELSVSGEITAERELSANQADLRRTQDIDASDIILEEIVAGDDAVRGTQDIDADDILLEEDVEDEPITDEFKVDSEDGAETFEAGVFNMKSLELEQERSGQWDDLAFLDELDDLYEVETPNTSDLTAIIDVNEPAPVLSVKRADLPNIPLFSDLNASTFVQLLEQMEYRVVPPDTYIIESGCTDPALFVIVRGTIVVERKLDDEKVELARMGEGEFFGEFALLTGRNELASVRAEGELALLEISKDVVHRIAETDPKIWDVLWDFYYVRVLNNMLTSSRIFRSMGDEARHNLINKFELKELAAGELLAGQGAYDDHVYIISLGEVQIEMPGEGGKPRVVDTLGEGEFLGLISGLANEPMVADVRAVGETALLGLAGEDFRRVVATSAEIEREVKAAVKMRRQRIGAAAE